MISQVREPLIHKGTFQRCCGQEEGYQGDYEQGGQREWGAMLHCLHSPLMPVNPLLLCKSGDQYHDVQHSFLLLVLYVILHGGRHNSITVFMTDYQLVLHVRTKKHQSFMPVVEIGGNKVSGIVSGTPDMALTKVKMLSESSYAFCPRGRFPLHL